MNKWFFRKISPHIEKTIAALGLKHVRFLGKSFGALLWFLLPGRRKLATSAVLTHVEVKGENKEQQAAQIAYESFKNNGQAFAELLLSPKVDHAFMEQRIEIVNPDRWHELKHYPGPGVAVTAHLGAWEILSGVMGTDIANKDRAIVVRKQRNEAMFERIAALRGATGSTVLGHRDAAPKVLRILKKEGLVAFLVDHNCNQRDAVFLPFLNEIAAVNVGPAVLAVRAKAIIWPIFLLRNGDNYKYYVEEPLLTTDIPGDREEKIFETAKFYTQIVEKYVRMFPEQWFWMHKRWKTRPPEEK